jgi:hypothetical protein
MANEKHLAILRQGVEAWNAWREKNRKDDIVPIGPDLAEVLGRIADHKITRIDEFLPWRYAADAA